MNLPWNLTKFEAGLWGVSTAAGIISWCAGGSGEPLPLIASLVGAAALIFVAKGRVAGQLLTVLFAVLYGIISLEQRYYGEMITYLGMSAPMAIAAAVAWAKNPAASGKEVAVAPPLTKAKLAILAVIAAAVTAAFYFILRALDTASLGFSTLSVTTSFLAAALTFLRSPYSALAYAANDVVLIVLWVIAAAGDPAALAMVACFAAFLASDLYGFVNWKRMEKRQCA